MKNYRLKIALILGLSLFWLVLPQTAARAQGIYKLTINVEGDGAVQKTPAQAYYDEGEIVELRANPGRKYIFSHWSGGLSGGTNPTEITMDGNKSVTAHFVNSGIYTLSILFTHRTCAPDEEDCVPDSPHGTVQVNPYAERYGDEHEEMYDFPAGTEVTLTGTGRFMDYDFSYWAGDIYSHDNPVTITINSDMRITPMWKSQPIHIHRIGIDGGKYLLNMEMPDGSIKPGWGDAGLLYYGDTVEIKARDPKDGEHFSHWSGNTEDDTAGIADIYSPHTTLTMYDTDIDIFANFEPDSEGDFYVLSVTAIRGRVTKVPQKSEYEPGEEVQLTAEPDAGYDFLYWEGDLTGSENPATIIMNSNKSVRAVFESPQYSLDIIALHGTVEKDPDKEKYHEDERIDLEADPDFGYVFKEWQGDLTGINNPAYIMMTGPKFAKTVTAVFEESEYAYTLEVIAEYGRVVILNEKEGYSAGDEVTLIAQQHPDYPDFQFVRWEGDLTGNDNVVTITMEGEKANKVVIAVFEPSSPLWGFALNITAVNGRVTRMPQADTYESGTPVTLLATPNTGYRFSGWSSGLIGTANPATLIMDGNKFVTANFSFLGALSGDVSGNGEITTYDATLAAQYSVRLIDLSASQVQAADVTGNGQVSSYDASLIAQYAIGLIEGF